MIDTFLLVQDIYKEDYIFLVNQGKEFLKDKKRMFSSSVKNSEYRTRKWSMVSWS